MARERLEMTQIVDRYLLFRIRNRRDAEAFGRLYDRYVDAIYRFAALKVRSKEEAEDVVSDTFMRAWEYVLAGNDVTHFRALLYRIARNLIADMYRKSGSASVMSVVTFEGVDTSTYTDRQLDSDRGQGQRWIEARADLATIFQKLDLLKEGYRDVLTLRLVDGLPFEVIADILEKKTGHVRVMFHRALKTLKDADG